MPNFKRIFAKSMRLSGTRKALDSDPSPFELRKEHGQVSIHLKRSLCWVTTRTMARITP